jgi:tetratricopeptide (TPR) repeat protein
MIIDSFIFNGMIIRPISVIIPYISQAGMERCKSAVLSNAGIPSTMFGLLALEDAQRLGVPQMVARLVEMSPLQLVCCLGDDIVPQPDFLRNALLALEKLPDQCGLVGLNGGEDSREKAAHWLADKRLLPLLGGEFFHTGYSHGFFDNELTDRCRQLGRYILAEDAAFMRIHPPGAPTVAADSEEARGGRTFARDRELYLLRRQNNWNQPGSDALPQNSPSAVRENIASSTTPMVSDMEKKFVDHIKSALHESLSIMDLVEFTGKLQTAGQPELAVALYRTWLAFNNTPYNHLVYFNFGVALSNLADSDAARDAYLQAIALSPSFVQPHLNLGHIYEQLGQLDAARSEWSWVVANTAPEKPDELSWRQIAANNLERIR